MEDLGHKLMAFRIDEQFLGILHSQFNQALEKLGAATAFSLEGKAAVEVVYYLLAFGTTVPGWITSMTGTPGMQAVGLSVHSEAVGTNYTANLLRALLILSYLSVKWSTLKLQEFSDLGGWFAYPTDTLERRTNECLKIGRIAAKCLSALSFVVFLCKGDYPDLLYRVANITTRRVGSAAARGAGYNSAQLFVEGKKMLWLALLGASAAATIAIDWRSLRYYCYFYVRSVLSMLHSLRRHSSAVISNAFSMVEIPGTRDNTGLSFVQNLFARLAPSTATFTNSIDTSNTIDDSVDNGLGNTATSSTTRSDTISNNSNVDHSVSTQGITTAAICSACHSASPEMPHRIDCGHVYCYICVHRLVSSADNEYAAFAHGNSAASNAVECIACFAKVTKYEPLSSI